MFDPTIYPYVRAQTYVDANPPAVLSDEFYNPTQDALARLYGGLSGYSMANSNEEFVFRKLSGAPAVGDRFGLELSVLTNPGGAFLTASTTPSGPNEHGVIRVLGAAAGARGGAPGFRVGEALRNVGTVRWIARWRVRCSAFATLETAPPGLQLAVGDLTSANFPAWLADGTTGFWVTFWDGGTTTTAVPTVDNEWINLWITLEDADGVCRWYYKRDTDSAPILADTQTLTTTNLTALQRWLRYQVTAGAAAADNIELDCIGFCTQR